MSKTLKTVLELICEVLGLSSHCFSLTRECLPILYLQFVTESLVTYSFSIYNSDFILVSLDLQNNDF